jgi:hypothetical protein
MKIGLRLAQPLFLPLSLLFLGSVTLATSFVDQPFPDTIQDAPIIVRGKTGQPYSDWGRGFDGNRRIYTYNELEIREVFKGSPSGKKVLLRELGGEKDGIGMEVSGASKFSAGEDVVVMLSEKNSEGSYDIRGLMMGKYNIQRNTQGEEILAGPGISSQSPNEGSQNDTQPPSDWTLNKLRAVILAQARHGSPDPNGGKSSAISTTPSPVAQAKNENQRPSSGAPQLQLPPDPGTNRDAAEFPLHLALPLGVFGILVAWLAWRRFH